MSKKTKKRAQRARLINSLRRRMMRYLGSNGLNRNNRSLAAECASRLGIVLPQEKIPALNAIAEALGEVAIDTSRRPTDAMKRAAFRAAKTKTKVVRLVPSSSDFYWSDEWRDLRYRALKQHGGCCQCCGNRAAAGKPLHVDHIKPRSKFPELELELTNLQVLCADCNIGKRAWDETDWREVK